MKDHLSEETKRKLAASLTAEDPALLPFLPFLLQDLWELGGDPEGVVKILKPIAVESIAGEGMRILDLACGKGAVAIELAIELGATVKGVDLMPDFVIFARQKAKEYKVDGHCTFEVGDVNEATGRERGWDCVVFSAAGSILGTPEETLTKLKATLAPGGYILLDDSCRKEGLPPEAVKYNPESYATEAEWRALFEKLGLREVSRVVFDDEDPGQEAREQIDAIRFRAGMMAAIHPDKKELFEGYVKSQLDEVADIEENLVNLQWLLQAE